MQIGDEVSVSGLTDLIVSPAGIPHGLIADEDAEYSVSVVKTSNLK